jgi:hypothetical protein
MVAWDFCSSQYPSEAGGQHRPGRVDALQLERIEQSGKDLADPGEDGDQPFMERIHGTRYYE